MFGDDLFQARPEAELRETWDSEEEEEEIDEDDDEEVYEDPAVALQPKWDEEDYGPASERPNLRLKGVGDGFQNEQVDASRFRVAPGQVVSDWNNAAMTPDANVTELRTRYLSPEEQAKHDLHAGEHVDEQTGTRETRLRDAEGNLLDTTAASGRSSQGSEGAHMFVMTPRGQMRSADAWELRREEEPKRRRDEDELDDDDAPDGPDMRMALANHSSLAAVPHFMNRIAPGWEDQLMAGKVAAAGEIRASQGRLTEINDSSGHYRPDSQMTGQAVRGFAGMGLDLHDTEVKLTGKEAGQAPMIASAREVLGVSERMAARREAGEALDPTAEEDFLRSGRATRAQEIAAAAQARAERARTGALRFGDDRNPKAKDAESAWRVDAERDTGGWGAVDGGADARQDRFKKFDENQYGENGRAKAPPILDSLRGTAAAEASLRALRDPTAAPPPEAFEVPVAPPEPQPAVEAAAPSFADLPPGYATLGASPPPAPGFADLPPGYATLGASPPPAPSFADLPPGYATLGASPPPAPGFAELPPGYATLGASPPPAPGFAELPPGYATLGASPPPAPGFADLPPGYATLGASPPPAPSFAELPPGYATLGASPPPAPSFADLPAGYATLGASTLPAGLPSGYATLGASTLPAAVPSGYATMGAAALQDEPVLLGDDDRIELDEAPRVRAERPDHDYAPAANLPMGLRPEALGPEARSYPTKGMDTRYQNEQRDASSFRGLGWDAFASTPDARIEEVRTRYLNPLEQQAHELSVGEDGRMLNAAGELADTARAAASNPSDQTADAGKHIFVMSGSGKLRAIDAWGSHTEEQIEGRDQGATRMGFVNHSSLAAELSPYASRDRASAGQLLSGEVAGAGELQLNQGKIEQITDSSGHYTPDNEMTGNVLDRLSGMGADLHDTALKLTGRDRPLHASVREFQAVRNEPRRGSETPADVMTARRDRMRGQIEAAAAARQERVGDGLADPRADRPLLQPTYEERVEMAARPSRSPATKPGRGGDRVRAAAQAFAQPRMPPASPLPAAAAPRGNVQSLMSLFQGYAG